MEPDRLECRGVVTLFAVLAEITIVNVVLTVATNTGRGQFYLLTFQVAGMTFKTVMCAFKWVVCRLVMIELPYGPGIGIVAGRTV